MKQEITNTFSEGLVGDLNPLTTPSNVLTDCLNGTFITYNGNEFVLQNDMGNSKVDTARLPVGYIPVGMKEHGGIIYVASHNPQTKKSQIGSFPSPQQLFNGTDLNIAEVNFDFSTLVNGSPIPYIENEYYRIKLFADISSGEARVFHPGDKFIIKTGQIPPEIKEAYNNEVIKFALGVVTSSGNIEYIEDDKLRIYDKSNGFWIFCTNDKQVEDILIDPSLIQIFNAKTSGELVLIIELKTIKAFNLLRKYSFSGSEKIVTLEGEMVSDISILNGNTTSNSNVGLKSDYGEQVVDQIVLNSKNSSGGKSQYAVSPVSIYGVLKRLKKTGIIDFDNIRPNQEISDEWRYYITNDYIKIGWSYDYFNTNSDQYLTKIRFTFIDFSTNLQDLSKTDIDNKSSYYVDLIKDYYNGSFEEVFSFDDNLKKNYIYIVRIDRFINNNGIEEKKSDPFYRLLYTGTYFNDYYSTELNYNNLQKKTESLPFETSLNINIKNPSSYSYKIKTNNDSTFTEKAPNVNDFRIISQNEITSTDQLKYVVKKQGTYNINLNINSNFTYKNKFSGIISNPRILQDTINSKINLTISELDNSDQSFNVSSALIDDVDMQLTSTPSNFTGTGNSRNATITLDRIIISKAGNVRNDSYHLNALYPIYYKDIDSSTENRLLGFKYINGGILGIAGKEDCLRYNSIYYKPGSYTLGTNPGLGDDKDLLNCNINMGNPTINLLWGYKGQEASLSYANHNRRSPSQLNNWPYGEEKNEVDRTDNFMLVCWKTEKDNMKVINLGSRRTETTNIGNTNIIRADLMVKCYLSQMLTVQSKTINGYLVGADANNYVYYKPFNTKAKIVSTFPNYETNVNFNLNGKDIQDQMNKWKSLVGINDILPSFKISLNNLNTFKEIELGSEINIESDFSILNCYTNAYSYKEQQLTTDYDPNKIYLGIPTGVADNNGIMTLEKDINGLYKSRVDDDYIYNWYNQKSQMDNDINTMFVLRDTEQGYKEIVAKESGISTTTGRWLEGKNSSAPDILIGINFGASKLFE